MTIKINAARLSDGISVLFVCMGNICRSPTAEGVFREIQRRHAPGLIMHIDSAGTHAYHVDQPPDDRAVHAAREHGIDISAHRGRVVTRQDFFDFNFILAMDYGNLSKLQRLRPDTSKADVRLLLEFAENCAAPEVPDPYYGGPSGFEQVLELVRLGSIGFLKYLCRQEGIPFLDAGYRNEKKPARS